MKHLEVKYNHKDDEWNIICDDEFLLATYSPDDIYRIYDIIMKDVTEKKMVEIIFSLELFKRISDCEGVDFVNRYMLTNLFASVIINKGVEGVDNGVHFR